jgi:hypothetical protein
MESYTIISIYNIIERKKILDLSKIFLKKKGVSTSYEIENDSINEILRFIFRIKNKVPFDLLKYLNELKVSNDKDFSDIEVTLNLVPISEVNFYGTNNNNYVPTHNRSKTSELKPNNNNESYIQRHYFNDYLNRGSSLLRETPYMDPIERERKMNKNENENKFNKNKFSSYFDKATILKEEFDKDKNLNMEKNEKNGPYDDQFKLKFRDVNKKKWVSKENFKFY